MERTTISDDKIYTDELVGTIAKSIGIGDNPGKVRWLVRNLRDLPDSVRRYQSLYTINRPKQVIDAFDRVANSISKLLLAYGADKESGRLGWTSEKDSSFEALILWQRAVSLDPDRPERMVQEDKALDSLQQQLDSIVQLRREVLSARAGLEGRAGSGHGGRRHRGDPVLNELFKDLLLLYSELKGTNKGITVDPYAEDQDKQVRGPLIDFFRLTLRPLGWRLTSSSIRARLIRMRGDDNE